VPDFDSDASVSSSADGELRCDPEPHGVRVLLGMFECVGRVDLGLDLDRFDRRALESERLGALAAAFAADALDLIAPRHRVGVVLQRDRALHRPARRIENDETAFDQLRRSAEAHRASLTARQCIA